MTGKVKQGGRVYAETGQFLVPLKKAEKELYVEKVREFARDVGFTEVPTDVAASLAFTN